MPDSLYLDANATTPLDPRVAEAMLACERSGAMNPASQHAAGRKARAMLEDAREHIAEMLGARLTGSQPDSLIFTSGGTEANNLALRGLAGPSGNSQRNCLVVSAIEHPSVLGAAESMGTQGHAVARLPVNRDGVVNLQALPELLKQTPRCVSLMLGNNETGVLQPVAEAAALCRAAGVPLHTDAVQAVGKIPVDFRQLGVDLLTATAHKLQGPRGIGLLLLRHDVRLSPLLFGGFQQEGLRPGTESVSLAIGFEKALELWHADQVARETQLRQLRDQFEGALLAALPNLVIHGAAVPRLPHTSNIAFLGINRQALLMALDLAGIACSTGSACASGSSEPSPVLQAMGVSPAELDSSLRFSFWPGLTVENVLAAARRIVAVVGGMRGK